MWQEPRWHDVITGRARGLGRRVDDQRRHRDAAGGPDTAAAPVGGGRELRERLKTALDAAAVPGEPLASAISAGAAAKAEAQASARRHRGATDLATTSPETQGLAGRATSLELRWTTPTEISFYEAVGGEESFRRLIHLFYQGVAADPELRAVYPAQGSRPSRGTPAAVPDPVLGRPGHLQRAARPPAAADAARALRHRRGRARRLAAAHADVAGRDGLDPALDAQLWDYLVMAAHSLVNAPTARRRRNDLGLTPRLRPGPGPGPSSRVLAVQPRVSLR